MSTAFIGFVGVFVGAIIAAGSNYLIAIRRERADAQRENRNRAIEIRRASRLIDADLSRAQAAATICVEKRHWWSTDVPPLTVEGWEHYRHIVAPELSSTDWVKVRVAVEAVDSIKTARTITIEAGLLTAPIPDSTAEQIAPMLNDIKAGRDALTTFMLEQPLQRRLRRNR